MSDTGNPVPGSESTPDATDWRAGLPDDLRAEKSLEAIKGRDWAEAGPALAKSYVHAQKMIGGSIRLPGPDAKPEERDALIGKLREHGVVPAPPAKPEEYQITVRVPEGVPVDNTALDGFRAHAHKHGLTQEQAQAMVDFYTQRIDAVRGQIAPAYEQTVEQLRKEWGGAYDRNVALAQRALREMEGGDELIQTLDATGLGNHPALVKFFAKLGAEMAEDGLIDTKSAGINTPADARAKIASIRNDRDHPFNKPGVPGHDEAKEEMRRLYDEAYGVTPWSPTDSTVLAR